MNYLCFLRWPLLLAGLLLLTACPKAEPEPPAVPLPAELKAYTLFRPGTYWIYQDSASQQLDSVWVVATTDSVRRMYDQLRLIAKYESFVMRTRSSQGGPDHVTNAIRLCSLLDKEDVTVVNGIPNFPCWTIKRGLSLPNSTADEGDSHVFFYRIDWTLPLNPTTLSLMTPRWHPGPYPLGNASYRDVVEVRLAQDASEYGWPSHYYWAPNVGIVRHRRWRGHQVSTWTLVRSRIVQ